MAVYAIGDLHGCYEAFRRLLALIQFNPRHDRLWLVGDLVNRGPDSLALLRWVRQHQHCITLTLGNHDLHLLAAAAGAPAARKNNAISEIINAPDGEHLCDFLRRQPLAHYENGWLMVHAGVLPQWDIEDILALATEVQQIIRGERWHVFARQMYGNQPARWHSSLTGNARWRMIVNVLTRMRICTAAGEIHLGFTGKPEEAPAGCLPWFDAPNRRNADTPIIFGHWSALGLLVRENLYALDSGCLWGGALTALRLSDRKIFQVTGEYSAATMPEKTNNPNQ